MSLAGERAEVLRSFGSEDGALRLGGAPGLFRILSEADSASFWASEVGRYAVTRWKYEKADEKTFVRAPAWFPGTDETRLGNHRTPPSPAVVALQTARRARRVRDADGTSGDSLLWVFVRVPARTWKLGWRHVDTTAREIAMSSIRVEELFDTMVEVLDVAKGTVVGRARLPGLVVAAWNAGDASTGRNGRGVGRGATRGESVMAAFVGRDSVGLRVTVRQLIHEEKKL
jgi:hypothetical protein